MRKTLQTLHITVSILLIACTLPSCTHYYYGPNSNNVPLLQKKDDGRILAAITGGDETTGLELQSAYAFGNHFGAMINFYTASGKDKASNNSSGSTATTYEKGNGTFIEFGGGYFAPVRNTNEVIFETYAGLGTGTINNDYGNSETSKVNATKIFIQPSISVTNKAGTFQAALSSRFSSVHLNLKQSNVTLYVEEIRDLENNSNQIFWEPSILIRGGLKNIKLQLQITRSAELKQKKFPTQGVIASLGLIFSFNKKVAK